MHAINLQLPIFRFLITSVLAMIVTLSLIALMQQLVKTDFVVTEDPIVTRINPPFMEKSVIEAQTNNTKDDRPEDVEQPPLIEFTEPVLESASEITGIAVAKPTIVVTRQKGPSLNLADGEAIPVVRVAPEYPARPQQRGIEGFVDIQFDVAPSGKTTNLAVIHAEPGTMFNRAALRAVSKWKYKPKVIDGTAVAQLGLKTRVRFGLEE